MPNSINTNIAAYFAQANIATNANAAASSVSRLASGNRLVQAADDVAALAIGASLQSQVFALKTAQTNASQGTSLLQVADGALAQIQSILQQQQNLALQAASGSLTDTNRSFLNQQFQALATEINILADSTTFNGVKLLDGSIATGGSNNPLEVLNATTLATQGTVTDFTASTSFTAVSILDSGATGNLTDSALIGDLSTGQFSVTATGNANEYVVSYTINDKTYSGLIDAAVTGSILDLFNVEDTAANSSTAKIRFTVSAGDITGNSDGDSAAHIQAALTTAFSEATAYGIHSVRITLATDADGNDIAGSGIKSTDTAGTLLNGFNGASITVQSQLFDGVHLPPIANVSATGSGATTVFSVKVNGVDYSTDGSTVTNSTTTISGANFGNGNGLIRMFKNGDNTSSEYVQFDVTGLAANALITTTDTVQELVDAFNTVLGSGGAAGGLSFQLGTTSTSNVTVNIASAKTTALYLGASLNISTQSGASTAATTVGTAIDTLTSLRAGVGALQSQFNFASAALQSSVQNQTAAVSQFLDTDIATESTAFATSQVKLQAGISVLAQANQQLQALLKLIG